MARYGRDYGGNRGYDRGYDADHGYREGWGMAGLANRFFHGGYDQPFRSRPIGGMGYWSGERAGYDRGYRRSGYDRGYEISDRWERSPRRQDFREYGRRGRF